jgi:hypothetical protein
LDEVHDNSDDGRKEPTTFTTEFQGMGNVMKCLIRFYVEDSMVASLIKTENGITGIADGRKLSSPF